MTVFCTLVVSLIKIHTKFLGGLHGVGISVVNALSTYLLATVYSRDGKIYEQEYSEGFPKEPVKAVGKTDITGNKN